MSEAADSCRPAGLSDGDRLAVETFYRAVAGRPDLLDRCIAADRQYIPLAPGARPCREGMKPPIAGFVAAFPNAEVTIHEIIGEAGRAEITATHGGEWFGVAPTDRRFSMPLHEFHRTEGGRPIRTWHLEGWLGWLCQAGAWPKQEETL